MRPLRWPRLWLGLWCAAVLAVIVLSLVPPPPMATQMPRDSDKLLHFSAYFALAFSAMQLFASLRTRWIVAIGLVALGLALEWAQGVLVPEARSADALDGLANALGVLAGLSLGATGAALWLLRLESRLAACLARRGSIAGVSPPGP
ncbi:MAG TPA: VanZ family protein [Chiayiivirga sp.]|nr:VanZ family protein [Chiayiivirga sp.]HRQ36087.1 VanZ family protein [Chiayiivirga sp.]